uniref:CSON006117 protein n=1 Tax=Culicoides sonorensis TaxID=179676 RepID=A0A336LVP1_CULSO
MTDHPNECWDKETNSFYQTGSLNQRKGKCEMIRCYADYSMDSVGCHTKPAQTGCTASKTDFSKSYPDCCPRINCNNNNNHNQNHQNNNLAGVQQGTSQTTSTQTPVAAQPATITKKPTTTTIHLPVTQKPVLGTKSK